MEPIQIHEYMQKFVDVLRITIKNNLEFLLTTSKISLPPKEKNEKTIGIISDEAKILFILNVIAEGVYGIENQKLASVIAVDDGFEKYDSYSVDAQTIKDFQAAEGYLTFLNIEVTAVRSLFWILVREEFPQANNPRYLKYIRDGWVLTLQDRIFENIETNNM